MTDLRVSFARGRRRNDDPVRHALDADRVEGTSGRYAVCGMPVYAPHPTAFDPSHPRACRDCVAGRLSYDRRPR